MFWKRQLGHGVECLGSELRLSEASWAFSPGLLNRPLLVGTPLPSVSKLDLLAMEKRVRSFS